MALFAVIIFFIIVAVGLTWFLLSRDKGEKEPIGALWVAFAFGFLGAIAAGTVESFVLPKAALTGDAVSMSWTLFFGMMGVGIIEEACKFLPLAKFIYRKRYFNEHTDGIIYFALAGLGFGLPENIIYTLNYGTKTGLLRLFVMPFFHVATTAFVGYFLIRRKLDRTPLWTVGAALAGVMFIHGLYDFSAASGNGLLVVLALMITLGVTTALFVLMMKARELDKAQGLAVVGNNAFCRSCGYPNPTHQLYCQRCGQRA